MLVAMVATQVLAACAGAREETADERFRAVQERGGVAMGVDQHTSTHVFEPLPDGGRIELQRDSLDEAGRATIRAHMEDIRQAFARGDFRIPGFVHDTTVPGTVMMSARAAVIRYEVRDLPGGAELRMTTPDTSAVRAIHEFLAYQRVDHRTHEH
jgi:hypothetical protein